MILDKDPSLNPIELRNEDEAQFELVSVLHGRLAEAYEGLPDNLKRASEFDLCDFADPGPSDYKMRQNFSDAVELARKTGKKLRVTSIYDDVISRQVFFDFYVKNQNKIAFIMRPVVPHHSYLDAIYKEGLRKMFLYVKTHDLDPKSMATFARIVEKAGDRVIGPVVQRIQMAQKQEITHVSGAPREVGDESPESLEQKIRDAQAKLDKIKPIEIEASSVDAE